MRYETDSSENRKKDFFKTQIFFNFNEKRLNSFMRDN